MAEQYANQGINTATAFPTFHFGIGNVGALSLAPIPGDARRHGDVCIRPD